MSALAVAAYVGLGFFLTSFTHSYYCKYFHDGNKRFGVPFIEEPSIRTNHRAGYVGATLMGILSFSLTLNYLTVFFNNFPQSVSGVEAEWFIALLAIGGFLIFVASPLLGGPAAIKWVLEGSLILFTLLLVLSIPAGASTFGQVQFIFSVSGAVLAGIYIFWLRAYVLHEESLEPDSMRDALDTFDDQSNGVWALWGTIVYFVFSGVYILMGYVTVFVILNA